MEDVLAKEIVDAEARLLYVRKCIRLLHKRGRNSWGFQTYFNALKEERDLLEIKIETNSIMLALHGIEPHASILEEPV